MAGIALEDLDAKLDFIVENEKAMERRLTERIDTLENNLEQKIADIHLTLRYHGEKLQKHDEEIIILKQSSQH